MTKRENDMQSTRSLRVAMALAFVATTAGCFEEKTTVTVHANGAGTVHLTRTFNEEFTKKNYEGKTEAEKQASAEASFVKMLADCKGIVAWQDVRGKVEGGHLIHDATGYFEDVTAVGMTNFMGSAPKVATFTWKKNPDGGFALTWNGFDTDDDGSKTFEKKRPSADEVAMNKKAMEAYKGLLLERTLVMPGKITATDLTVTDRSASAKTTLADIDTMGHYIDECWAKIDKKELTKEAAAKECQARFKKLSLTMDVTCAPPADANDAAAFEKELTKAKAAYKDSALEKKIKASAGK